MVRECNMREPSGECVAIKCSKVCVRRDQMANTDDGRAMAIVFSWQKLLKTQNFCIIRFHDEINGRCCLGDLLCDTNNVRLQNLRRITKTTHWRLNDLLCAQCKSDMRQIKLHRTNVLQINVHILVRDIKFHSEKNFQQVESEIHWQQVLRVDRVENSKETITKWIRDARLWISSADKIPFDDVELTMRIPFPSVEWETHIGTCGGVVLASWQTDSEWNGSNW